MRAEYRRPGHYFFMGLILLIIVACGSPSSGEIISPTAEEQIKNVALDFFVRDSAVPAYEADIAEIEGNWARVTLTPVDVTTTEPLTVYLQNQAESDVLAPTAEPMANPGNIAPTNTELGWAVITPPQAHFSSDELNALAVPANIRP